MTRPHRLARGSSRLRPAVDRLEGRALMATAGSLDPTFGGGRGYVVGSISAGTSTPTSSVVGQAVAAVEPDGAVVVATSDPMANSVSVSGVTTDLTLAVRRLNADGTPDTTFGTDGKTDVPLPAGFAVEGGPSKVLIGPNGQILLIGILDLYNSAGTNESLLATFNADGSLDTNFGTGGVVTTTTPIAADAAFEPNGDAVVAALGGLRLLTPQGTFDTSFGTNGLAAFPSASGLISQVVGGLAVQPDGQIVALVVNESSGGNANVLVRFNADGSPDTSVSQAGIQASGIDGSSGVGVGLAIEPDGQYLVLGSHQVTDIETTPVLALLKSDGTLAKSETLFSAAAATFTSDLTLQPNGDVVMLADSVYTPNSANASLYRLTPELTPDPTFGVNGLSLVNIPPATGTSANFAPQLAGVTPDNQVILAGSNEPLNEAPTNDFVARLRATPTPATPGDYYGDGVSDPAVFLAGPADLVIGNSSGGPGQVVQLGAPGQGNTIPAPGDYAGIGRDAPAVYMAQFGYWAIQDPTGQTPGLTFPFGQAGVGNTVPVQADYSGTGQDDVAVYLTQSATWDILKPGLEPGVTFPFGVAGVGQTVPVPGDYYGTGQSDVAVYLTRTATWAILAPGLNPGFTVQFGIPGAGNSIPVPGDYDGSGRTELAVYLPALGELQYISAKGTVVTVPFGIPGAGQTLPEPGDYDGSGKTEVAAYLPALNTFAYRPANGGPDVSFVVGFAGSGPIVPVTQVPPSPLLVGSGSGSGLAIEPAGVTGQADALDFLMPLASDPKKARAGDTSAH